MGGDKIPTPPGLNIDRERRPNKNIAPTRDTYTHQQKGGRAFSFLSSARWCRISPINRLGLGAPGRDKTFELTHQRLACFFVSLQIRSPPLQYRIVSRLSSPDQGFMKRCYFSFIQSFQMPSAILIEHKPHRTVNLRGTSSAEGDVALAIFSRKRKHNRPKLRGVLPAPRTHRTHA